MIDFKALWPLKVIHSHLPMIYCRPYCTTKMTGSIVNIPKRIDRGPTDILKALAKTVHPDYTGQPYKYPDDPFFEVKTNISRRTHALCIESGKKSARWIVKNNPEFFRDHMSEPLIKSFIPQVEYNEKSDVDENTLVKVIEEKNVSDAIKIYTLLSSKNIEISKNVKQRLLELVCFYNCEKRPSEEELESKWFQNNDSRKKFKTWRDKEFAEKLFESISADCPLAVSALIQGMLKYGQIERALELFNAATDKNLKLTLGVYNGILLNVVNIKESRRWNYILEILGEMKMKKIKPNLYTLNAILGSLCEMVELPDRVNLAMRTIAEFNKLNIEPSLGSYNYLITMKCKGLQSLKKERILFLQQLLREIKEKKLDIMHPSDMLFFPSVMKICGFFLKSSESAHILNDILMNEDNIKFIQTNVDANMYYFDYFSIVFTMEPIEWAMELYKNLVPSIYIPEPKLYLKILHVIDNNEAYEFLPVVWSTLKLQSKSFMSKVHPKVLSMVTKYKNDTSAVDVADIFICSATYIYNIMEGNETHEFKICDEVISDAIIAFLRFGKIKEALSMTQRVFNTSDVLSLSHEALSLFYEFCMSKGLYSHIRDCLKHADKTKHPKLKQMARNALTSLPDLSESDSKWLTGFVESRSKNDSTTENELNSLR